MNLTTFLIEVFDSPVKLTYNKEATKELEDVNLQLNKVLSVISVYSGIVGDQEYFFYVFRFKGAWEVHFSNSTANLKKGILGIFKGANVSQLIATILSLYSISFDKGRTLRFYSDNPKMNRLFELSMEYFLKKHPTNITIDTVVNFINPYGESVRAIEIKHKSTGFSAKTLKEHVSREQNDG